MQREPFRVNDILKFVILAVAALAFLFSVGAKFFHPQNDINNVSTVFLGVVSVVLGASSLSSYFSTKKKEGE